MKKYLSASAHLVVVILLTLALLGSVGYIFYDKFVAKDSNQSLENQEEEVKNTDNSNNEDSNLDQIVTEDTFDTNLSIRYPSDWSKITTSNTKDGMGLERSVITSADGKAQVQFIVGVGGIGGYCEPESYSTIYSLDYDEVSDYPDVRFASTVVKNNDDTYNYYMGIQSNDDEVSGAKVGDSGCAFFLKNLPSIEGLMTSHVQLYVEFKDVTNDAYTTANSFEQIKSTENYAIAKQIIQSLHIKQ